MNTRIVILGDDEFLSDSDIIEDMRKVFRKYGCESQIIFTNDDGMNQGVEAALETRI